VSRKKTRGRCGGGVGGGAGGWLVFGGWGGCGGCCWVALVWGVVENWRNIWAQKGKNLFVGGASCAKAREKKGGLKPTTSPPRGSPNLLEGKTFTGDIMDGDARGSRRGDLERPKKNAPPRSSSGQDRRKKPKKAHTKGGALEESKGETQGWVYRSEGAEKKKYSRNRKETECGRHQGRTKERLPQPDRAEGATSLPGTKIPQPKRSSQ